MVEKDYRIGQNITRKTFILHTTTALYRIRVAEGLFYGLVSHNFRSKKSHAIVPLIDLF
jgi:hypothetical protein